MTTSRRAALGLLGISVASSALAASANAAPATRIPADLRPGGALDRFIREQADKDAFSGSVLLTHGGRTVLARSYGMANRERSVPNGPDTIFVLASVTKLFTAVAVAQLAQRGALKYDASLGSYLDGFPSAVTVHHLLTHTSGFGDPFQMPGYLAESATWTSIEQVMSRTTDYIRQSKLAFPPGAAYQYSNAGYHLLGEIVARVSGQSYFDYVREHVLHAADMTSSDFYTRPQWKTDPRFAHPYATQPSGQRTDVVDQRMYSGTPAGDAFTTCADLERFARALHEARLLDPAFTAITLGGKLPPPAPTGPPPPGGTPSRARFQCYGPMAVLVGGQWAIGHSGGAPGTSTEVQLYPDSGYVWVYLSNYDSDRDTPPPITAMARKLIAASS